MSNQTFIEDNIPFLITKHTKGMKIKTKDLINDFKLPVYLINSHAEIADHHLV